MDDPTISFGEFIRQRRADLGIEQQELARRIGRDATQLVRWERPSAPGWLPPYDVVLALARELQTPLDLLVFSAFPDAAMARFNVAGVAAFERVESLIAEADIAPDAAAVVSMMLRAARAIQESHDAVEVERQRLAREREELQLALQRCRDEVAQRDDELEVWRHQS